MSNLANNTVTMNEILALINSLPEAGETFIEYSNTKSTEIAPYTYHGLGGLKSVSFSAVTIVGDQAFNNCQNMEIANFPAAISVGNNSFYRNVNLQTPNFPVLETAGNQAFLFCLNVKRFDFPALQSVGNRCFGNCTSLEALILRSTTMCVAGTNPLSNSAISDEMGYIYVPSSLLNTYKADDNWGQYANQFRALESYTVDGTTTGALDETKI